MVEEATVAEPKETFLDGISPEFHSAISGFTDKNGLAKGYTELYSKLGSYTKLPTEESTPEEKSAFYNKQGRPETPEGYTLPELPEGKEYDQELLGGMRTIAHEAGITDNQFKKMIERYLGIESQRTEAARDEKARAELESERLLKEKWGAEYPANAALVQRACDELIEDNELHDAFAALIEEKGLKNNPVFAEVFCGIGQKMLDDTFVKSEGQAAREEEYVPEYPNDPDMYRSGDSEKCKKARAYFEKQGHIY